MFINTVNTIPTHALFIKTLIVLKNQALHMFRPANWPSSGANSVPQHNHRTTKNFVLKKNLYNIHTPHDKPIERDYAVKRYLPLKMAS
jgi:hypothetical protein